MFSGLIAFTGFIENVKQLAGGGVTLLIRCEDAQAQGAQPGDSIAINGVCLTATRFDRDNVEFDVVPETLQRSTLGALATGDLVNVEYSLRLGDRMGGHFVYGHVDATGEVLARTREGQGECVRIAVPATLSPMTCEKAFVAVDGVSVTVAASGDDWFEIALIPETLSRTTLGSRPEGSRVNLEVDPIARYVAAALNAQEVQQ
ncbi:MAG: riboflavin synthase [Candidatus Eremiobacteraeota bacterium]|nr:riboflavin synthase [Candidatus Eremiobacteraeota bacterium]